MKPLFAALLVAIPTLVTPARGQNIPGAGTILQQVQPALPALPSPTGTGLTIQQKDGAIQAPGTPFLVSAIRISGNTVFDTATLHALVADAEGNTVTLAQLDVLLARISNYYRGKGYPLARAIVPAQSVVSGALQVAIIEARYGQTLLENSSRVNDPLLLATLATLQAGQVVDQTELDHALLLLSDIPGVAVSATLRPGAAVGASDLLVSTVTSGPAMQGSVVLDNDGNRYTGRVRAGAALAVIDPLHHGDILSLNVLSSGRGMHYGRIAYDTLLNGKGTRLGGSASALRYVLGEPLAALNAHGTAQLASLWAKHPLVRSRDVNLYAQFQYERLQLRDHIDTIALRTDRHIDSATMSLIGDERDALLTGGVTTWNVAVSSGRVGFDDGAAQLADAATAQTRGTQAKWSVNLIRLQGLDAKNSVYFSFTGQGSGGNLDASQKISAGGPFTVRAYDVAAVSGDTACLGTVELRHSLGAAFHGQWQASAFFDAAHVALNKSVWVASANSATLRGAGVGLNWTADPQWSARFAIAAPLGARPVLVAERASVRAWAEISRGF